MLFTHARGGEFLRYRLRHQTHAALRRRVERQSLGSLDRGNRRDLNNRSATGVEHALRRELRRVEHRIQVEADGLIPPLRAKRNERCHEPSPARVVHQDVQASEFGHRTIDQPFDLIAVRDVGRNDACLATALLDFLRQLCEIGFAACCDRDIRSRFRERNRDRPPDPARGSGDYRDSSFE
jgi:hypothetical protein